jgi:hypothetical protein
MNTEDYINSIDGEFRFSEMDRLYIDLPTNILLSLVPKEYQSLVGVKNFIKFGIVKDIRPVLFSDNKEEFQSGYDFLYHNESDIIFSCIQGQHSRLMGAIYAVTKGIKDPNVLELIKNTTDHYNANNSVFDLLTEYSDFECHFIDENLGFYLSSSMVRAETKLVTIGENYILNNEEIIALKGFYFTKI